MLSELSLDLQQWYFSHLVTADWYAVQYRECWRPSSKPAWDYRRVVNTSCDLKHITMKDQEFFFFHSELHPLINYRYILNYFADTFKMVVTTKISLECFFTITN
jgi:hypothetical protein